MSFDLTFVLGSRDAGTKSLPMSLFTWPSLYRMKKGRYSRAMSGSAEAMDKKKESMKNKGAI